MCKVFVKVMLVASLLVTPSSEATDKEIQSTIVTCSGLCGVNRKLPCSCHAKCFLYQNCCENITVDCPELLAESRSRYGAVLDAKASCSDSGIWVISSCPKRRPIEKRSAVTLNVKEFMDEIVEGEDGEKVHLRQNSIKSRNETMKVIYKRTYSRKVITKDFRYDDGSKKRRLKRSECCPGSLAFKNEPLWDRSTGISYVNYNVFKCNGGKASNMVQFNVAFKVLEYEVLHNNPNLVEIAKSFTGDVIYEPPFSSDSEAWSPCLQDMKGRRACKKKILSERPELLKLCEDFISPINTVKGIFRNRFCYFCFAKKLERFKPIPETDDGPKKRTDFKLSVTFSVTESNSFQVTLRDSFWRKVTWSNSVCISDLFLQGQRRNGNSNLICNLQNCPPNFKIGSDGECKTSHNTFIGFSDDNLPRKDKDQRSVSRFLGCGIQKYLGIEVVEVSPSMIIQHNGFLNKTIYVSNMSTFLPADYSLSPNHTAFQYTVLKLLNLSQALSEYLKPRNESFYQADWDKKPSLGLLPKETPSTIKGTQPLKKTISSRTPKNLQTFRFVNVQDEVNSLSRNSSAKFSDDNDATTVVCLASSPATSGPVTVLNCLQGHLSESDMASAFEIVNSSCFSVVINDLGNRPNIGAYSIFISFCFFTLITCTPY